MRVDLGRLGRVFGIIHQARNVDDDLRIFSGRLCSVDRSRIGVGDDIVAGVVRRRRRERRARTVHGHRYGGLCSCFEVERNAFCQRELQRARGADDAEIGIVGKRYVIDAEVGVGVGDDDIRKRGAGNVSRRR